MSARIAAGVVVTCAVALTLVACRSTQAGISAGDTTGGGARTASVDAALPTLPDAAGPQWARFSLLTPDGAKPRRFVPGLALTRMDADGGAAPVTLPPATTSADGQQMTVGPISLGHYRADFLVAACAPESDAGECKPVHPRPDSTEFDVPATGDVEVTVR